MSKHYTAYQYEPAYKPRALRNWEVPKFYCNKPRQRAGRTKIIANDTGNLLPGVYRSSASPWGNFVGTWSMPRRITIKLADEINGSAIVKSKIDKCYRHYTAPPARCYSEEKVDKSEEKPKVEEKHVPPVAKDEPIVDDDEEESGNICPIHDV